jgi:hypothetical protein
MSLRTIAFALSFICYTETLVFAAGPVGSINIGHWSGGGFTDDKTGLFSHCATSAAYQNGFLLTIGQNSEKTWLLAIANPGWNLTLGETFPIDLTFDGQAQFHFFASANSNVQIGGILPNAALERMRKSHLMIAAGKLQTVPFSLNEIDKIIPIIALCVDRIRADGLAKAVDFAAWGADRRKGRPHRPPVADNARLSALQCHKGKSLVAHRETASVLWSIA